MGKVLVTDPRLIVRVWLRAFFFTGRKLAKHKLENEHLQLSGELFRELNRNKSRVFLVEETE